MLSSFFPLFIRDYLIVKTKIGPYKIYTKFILKQRFFFLDLQPLTRTCGEIGRHAALRGLCSQERAGSSPVMCTLYFLSPVIRLN